MKDCGIVKDLLPLIAEDMASEESTAFVKTHLETCEDCRKAYEEMKAPVEAEPAAPLKTVRKAVKKRGWLIAGLIACLVAALLVGAFARLTKPIVIASAEEAFHAVSIEPGVIPLIVDEDGTISRESNERFYIIVQGGDSDKTDPYEDLQISLYRLEEKKDGTIAPVDGSAPEFGTVAVLDRENAVLKIEVNPNVTVIGDRDGATVSFYAYTTKWNKLFPENGRTETIELQLADVNAVFYEPYSNMDRETLYVREGYTPEAGYALQRLVMNYYFLIALVGTVLLAAVWFILRLLKKQKASRIFGILLLIAASGVLAFLFAGFPATTIQPLRDLIFVCIIAVLLIGTGLCGRKLMRKE